MVSSGTELRAVNCVSTANGAYGVANSGATINSSLFNCAFWNNTTAQIQVTTRVTDLNTVTLSGDPFVARSTGDFRRNNTSGAGTALKQAGLGDFLEIFNSMTGTVASPDIGIQTLPSGGAALNREFLGKMAS
jgi:hypothetical protein